MDIAFPLGYRAGGIQAGLKASGKPDLALILSDRDCAAAAVFTQNRFPGEPVRISQKHYHLSPCFRAILINSGQANVATGLQGREVAERMTQLVAERIGCKPEEVLVASTGVIGFIPDIKKIERAFQTLLESSAREGWAQAAEAILTTDSQTKIAHRKIHVGARPIRIVGIAKGSGMIHPNMATMLAFLATDATISSEALRLILQESVEKTFNCITVDGDTSTSDMAFLLANGASDAPAVEPRTSLEEDFRRAILEVCMDLSRAIVRDGEGATRLVTLCVNGARNDFEARNCAKSIALSNLVKCAIFGRDPNWGRILCAIGNSKAHFDPNTLTLQIGPTTVFEQGRPLQFDEVALQQHMEKHDEIEITVNLNVGVGRGMAWTCDFSYEYVKINAEYHT